VGVIAYHLIMTMYGFWSPNDPRGSWSKWVRAWELHRFGNATRTDQRRSLARDDHDRAQRRAAKDALARDAVKLTGVQARAIGRGFAEYCRKSECGIVACSIMRNHTHLVTLRHRYSIEQVANLLKGAASRQLAMERLHPFQDNPYRNGDLPTPWARRQWACYLNSTEDIQRAIRYVENNPVRDGMKPQHWPFVTPFLECDLA
jgi:REP element-mobilizing transposase RayT